MRYIVTCDSDIGKVKNVNQDSVGIKHVEIGGDEIIFAVLCDGMGGFEDGELASATVLKVFMDWFDDEFLNSLKFMESKRINSDWNRIVERTNATIYEYGIKNGIRIGTTATVMLIWGSKYYILNIGDCRAYEFDKEIRQITKDHSWVAREVEEGRMTKEEARLDSRKNRLLKCIGGVANTSADFFEGKVISDAVYMLCCDGVRNKVKDEELFYYFHPECMTSVPNMENNIKYIFELNKSRNESDNMSVILIKDNDNDNTVLLSENYKVQIIKEKLLPAAEKIIEG